MLIKLREFFIVEYQELKEPSVGNEHLKGYRSALAKVVNAIDKILLHVTIKDVVLSHGYEECGIGYKKVTDNNTHWVSIYSSSNKIQVFGFYTNEPEDSEEKMYDTGLINSMTAYELDVLITMFLRSHP